MTDVTFFTEIKTFLFAWQTLVGSFVGASIPFLLWGWIEWYGERKKRKEYLYYLQRVIVDQANQLVDSKRTVEKFVTTRLASLINNISANPAEAYSVEVAFFPLFSVRPLPVDINRISSGSGYVDNKVANIYFLSEDFPHIINDMRMQFRETLEKNEKIALGKLNSPQVQKSQFIENILGYQKVTREDFLDKNIPIYLKKLVETLVAIEVKAGMSSILWKFKFDPFWRFYSSKSEYLIDREQIMENMDKFFEVTVKERLEKINQTAVDN